MIMLRLSNRAVSVCRPLIGTRWYKPELPDYNTDVNIHDHKLKRPEVKPKPKPTWVGLEGLEERTKGSLIPETLENMEKDEEFKITAENLKKLGQKKLTREERKKRQRALDNLGVPNFLSFWAAEKKKAGVEESEKWLRKTELEILQLNLGIYCNQACSHCHVESSPKRKEMMNRETADRCLHILKNSPKVNTLDLTGGAPELCSEFIHVVSEARKFSSDLKIIDRCNLTSLLEPGQEDTVTFLAEHRAHIIASLPCYTSQNVNMQRGSGVFDKSIRALNLLNAAGYGREGSGLELDLVYNPLGAYLPPPQEELRQKYKEELWETFGIEFNKLITITNMPIKRFTDFLYRRGELEGYMQLLTNNYNLNTMDNLMCLNTLSVAWNGKIYDCDFNQQLDMPLVLQKGATDSPSKSGASVWDVESATILKSCAIAVDNHCFGCTSGMGSSCQGTLSA
ncbi:PREDICTED: uncharacterized protein LOC106805372 [Priapulus caudatus]|uniref:Uncharacterized protein LOC106805372 n=1 Tax=Priapulus caudatus TaxID=37621 RepID=A0ABM1DR49_PRICU|nr:PREDICTED: uncharacterized protein LOC106805372 [Priapulus caudatus]